MLVLGIETASPRGSAALVDGGRVLLELSHDVENSHAERVLALTEELFRRCGLRKSELSRIGVGCGPGSFTGLRVGIALAQGIGLGLGVPVIGVPSLATLAHAGAAAYPGFDVYGALLDARREEVFVGFFSSSGEPVSAIQTLKASELAAQLVTGLPAGSARTTLLCGEFAVRHSAALLALGFEVATAPETYFPSAGFAALLTAGLAPGSGAEPVPLYVREPDALLPTLPTNPLLQPTLTGLAPTTTRK